MLIIYVIGGAVNDALLRSKKSMSVTIGAWVICFMYPRKLQHTPGAHPRQSPYPTMKGFPLQPVGKGLGVCSSSVC